MSSVRADEDKFGNATLLKTPQDHRVSVFETFRLQNAVFNHTKLPPAFSNLSTMMSDPAKCGRNLT